MIRWIAAAVLTLAVAVSTFELSCVASERTGEPPAVSASVSGAPMGPDLPHASELDDRDPASMPVLTY